MLGGTLSTFWLASTEVGKTFRIAVTATNAFGSRTATSLPTAVVGSASLPKPVSTAPPTISGASQPGSTLSASTGSWSNTPTSYAYQWQRCDSAGGACAAVLGGTLSTFWLASTEVGKTFRVAVTASNSSGSTTATSAATAVVSSSGAIKPANTVAPVISGQAKVGSTLTTSAGSWTGTTPISFAYSWRRCDSAGGACVVISGVTSASYAPTSADLGKTLRSAVSASNSAGSATATSNATAAVVAATTSGPIPGIGIHRLGSAYATASGYNRYSYVVVGRGDATKAAALPGTSLVYHSGTAVSSAFDTGVPYSQAVTNNWLLKTSGGALITARGYPTSYLADVGSTAYRQTWISNVSAYLSSTGADGVYIDDVVGEDRKSTRLNSSHIQKSRMPSSA